MVFMNKIGTFEMASKSGKRQETIRPGDDLRKKNTEQQQHLLARLQSFTLFITSRNVYDDLPLSDIIVHTNTGTTSDHYFLTQTIEMA